MPNLIKRRKVLKPGTTPVRRKVQPAIRTPAHPEVGIVYFVVMERDDNNYYVNKVHDSGAIMWTPNRDQAMKFHTENGAQHFVHAYLKKRNVHLQQAKSEMI